MGNVSTATMAQIQSQGVAVTGDIGGLRKTRYFTPDGREILAIPSIREYVKRVNGKVVETGSRDANLDKGWLLQPPTELKLYCKGCDKWHDTLNEIEECITKKKTFEAKWDRKVQKKHQEGNNGAEEIENIKTEMAEIKNLLIRLLEREV